MAITLDETALENIAKGAAFLGSGGGGSYKIARKMISDITRQEHPVQVISVDEATADATWQGNVIAFIGSPNAMFALPGYDAPASAAEAMAHYQGRQPDYYLPIEVGAINSLAPMTVAARKGIPVLDADGAGRAIPQLEMTTFDHSGIAISPAVLAADKADNDSAASVTLNVPNARSVEAMARPILTSDTFRQIAGLACYPLRSPQLGASVITGTLTRALQIGEAIEQAIAGGSDPVDTLLSLPELQPAYLLGRGTLIANTVETKGGFDLGKLTIKNTNDDSTITLHYKNENLIAFDGDDRPIAMAPDSICCITEAGIPMSNADLPQGAHIDGPQIALIGLKGPEKLRTRAIEEGFLEILRKFGYQGSYIPIEQLHD